MELEFQNKLINIINSSDMASEVRTLSFDLRRTIFNLSDFLSRYFIEQCTKRNVYLFNREEATELYNKRSDRYTYDTTFFKIADLSDDIKEKIYYDSGCRYLFALEDEERLIEMVASAKRIDRLYFDSVSDSVIEKMVLDPRNNDNYKLLKIISSFKNSDYIIKYMTKIPKSLRTSLISDMKSDEEKAKYIGYFTPSKSQVITSISDDVIKEECLVKYSPVLLPIEKALILLSFKDIGFLERNLFLLNSEKDVFQLFEYNYDRIKLPAAAIKKLHKEKYITSIITDGFLIADDKELLEMMIDRIKSPNNLYEAFAYCMDKRIQDFILPKLSSDTIEKYVRENMGAQMSEKVLLYIENDDTLIEALRHFHFTKPYSEELFPIFERVAKKLDLNLDHLIEIAKISDCNVLGVVKNPNIRKAINLGEESFNKYVSIFSSRSRSLDISKINSVLTIILHKSFELNNPADIQIFSNTLHNIEDKKFDDAMKKIRKVCKLIDFENYNISEEDLFEGLINNNQRVLTIYNKMTHEYLLNARNGYIDRNIERAFLSSTDASYERSSALKLFTRVFDADYVLLHLRYLDMSEKLTPEEKAFINDDALIRKIVSFKKGFIEYNDFSGNVKEDLRMFDDLIWKTFSHYSHFGDSDLWLIGGSKLPKVPGVGYEFSPQTFDVTRSILQIMAELDVDKLDEMLFKNSDTYERLLDYLEKYGMIGWGSSFEKICSSIDVELSSNTVAAFISNYPFIEEERKKVVVDKNASLFMRDMSLAMCLDSQSSVYSYIFGEEDYRLISGNIGPFSSPMLKRDRLTDAVRCVKTMHDRQYITVPPMDKNVELSSNKTLNFLIGNTNDSINLTYGERTGACMRIGGAADTLFNFCLGNENGFHVSFNDPETGELISRVSCFRNGNTLFLNQLRFSLSSKYSNSDVVEACKLMGKAVIEATKDSKFPIVNVVASNGYALENEKTVETFCDNPKEGYSDFYSDIYGHAVVIATSGDGGLQPIKLGPSNAERYKVGRARIKTYMDPVKASMAVQRIHVLEQFYGGTPIEDIDISLRRDIKKSYVGEDWYIAITNAGEIMTYCLESSHDKEKAIQEMKEYIDIAKKDLSINKVISVSNLKENKTMYINNADEKGCAM